MILLGKFGFHAEDVKNMEHAEISAWVDSYLTSLGVKASGDEQHESYVFQRKK